MRLPHFVRVLRNETPFAQAGVLLWPMNDNRCRNMNHSRSNIPIRFCPDCGDKVNASIVTKCDDPKHAARRKDRNTFCCDCGKNLRTP